MKKYILGNCLRGYFEGEFNDQEEAWRWLSKRFLLSYPAKAGRSVHMLVYEKNQYGIEQNIICQRGITSLSRIRKKDVLEKCSESLYYG